MFRIVMPLPTITADPAIFRQEMKAALEAKMKEVAATGTTAMPWMKKPLVTEDASSGAEIKINIRHQDFRYPYIEFNKGKMPPIKEGGSLTRFGAWAKANGVPAFPAARKLLALGQQYKGSFGRVWDAEDPQIKATMEVAVYTFVNERLFTR